MRTATIVAAVAAAVCLLLAIGRITVTAYQAAKKATDSDADLPDVLGRVVKSSVIPAQAGI